MRCYYAKQGDSIFCGSWLSVLEWARRAVKKNSVPVPLLTVRGGERFERIIAEVTQDDERLVRNGRIIKTKALRA